MTNRQKAYAALLTNAAIWGLALPLAKKGFEQTTPMAFLFYRYLFAVIVSLPIVYIYRKKLTFKLKNVLELSLIAVFSTVLGHWLLYTGVDKSTSLEGSLITALIPIIIVIGGAVFLKETVTGIERWGIALALIGTIIIIFEPLMFNHQKLSLSHTLGNMMILGYNFSWAIAVLWMKKVAKKYHPFTLSYTSFIVGLLGFFILALVENPQFLQINYINLNYAFLAAVYMGTLGSVVAYFLYQYGQQYIEASEATLFSYLSSIFALPLAIFWLNEKLTLPVIIGSIIVIAGIFIAEKRWAKPTKRKKPKPRPRY